MENGYTKPDADIQRFQRPQQNAPGTPAGQIHQHHTVPSQPPFDPPLQYPLPVMLQCLSSALEVLRQINENCRMMSTIAGFSAEWEAHYNDHFAEDHARLQVECRHLLSQQLTIIEQINSPVNTVHPVEQFDAKHHSTKALPMQKGRKMHSVDDQTPVHDRRELQSIIKINLSEDEVPPDATKACKDPWPNVNTPGLATPPRTSRKSLPFKNGCSDVINAGSSLTQLLHVSSQLLKPVSRIHLRNFNSISAGVQAHFTSEDQLIIFAVSSVHCSIIVATGTSRSPKTTLSHRPRLRPKTRWKSDITSLIAPIINFASIGPRNRSWSITSPLFLVARVVC